jgi:SnoaL-like domain
MEAEMTNAAQIADRYIAVWNETDPALRRTLLADGWAENATYVDPLMAGEGHEQIGALIGAVHERFPGFRFALSGGVDGYGDKVRFSWMLGPQNEPDMIEGTDFAVLEGERLKSVTGFLDKVPAGA